MSLNGWYKESYECCIILKYMLKIFLKEIINLEN